MRDRKFCLIWHYDGKVYFGGWAEQQHPSDNQQVPDIIKSGIGM